jgi:hypothetical protein
MHRKASNLLALLGAALVEHSVLRITSLGNEDLDPPLEPKRFPQNFGDRAFFAAWSAA